MKPVLYLVFFFFLVANVIALPGVRETDCTSRPCQKRCICDYDGCMRRRTLYGSLYINCERTYECGTC